MQKAQFEAAIEQERLRGTLELQAEKVRADMALKAYQADAMMQNQTLADLEPEEKEAPAIPPIIVNVDAKQPMKKRGVITRTPDGRSVVEVQDVPDEQPEFLPPVGI